MKLTPFAKLFITVVVVAVLGYAGWYYKGADVKRWAVGDKAPATTTDADKGGAADFDALKGAPPDPDRGTGSTGVAGTSLTAGGKLSRPLVVGINTWAGHAPGIVANGGMDSTASGRYKQRYNLNVTVPLMDIIMGTARDR